MRLPSFIDSHLDAILLDWVAFARCQLPAAADIDEVGLLDHGKQILQKILADMHRPEDDDHQQAKSEGQRDTAAGLANVPSRSHARQRERQGFEVEQMVAEYRALRATVLRLWAAHSDAIQVQDLEDVTRFNEAVDQAMAESLAAFVVEVNKTHDLFLGMLGHDLRGPLSTISGYAALTLRNRPEEASSLAVVQRSVAQMKALLDDLVEYTRHRLGSGLSVDPAPLQLDKFAHNTLQEIEAISPSRTLTLTSEGDLHGEWDARRLHQALSNLVFNALKYGFPDAPVRVRLDGNLEAEVVLTVENDGKPISPAMLPRLFDPLVRADGDEVSEDSQVAGANLGLGLYVVREIATAHGGTVEVRSDASSTCFELRLPRFCGRPCAKASRTRG